MDNNSNSNIRLLHKERLIELLIKRTYSRREYAEQLANEILEICKENDKTK